MQEILLETLIYGIDNPLLTLVIAFIAGFAREQNRCR